MAIINEGMLPSEFVSAINSNTFNFGSDIDAMQFETFLTILNEKFDIYDRTYLQNNLPLTAGLRGQQFIDRINANFALRQDGSDFALKTLIDNGTFTPATSSNIYLAKYKNFSLGGLISFSMYTFDYAYDRPMNPYVFNLTNVDVEQWVSDALDAGIQYLVLTVHDNAGFALFDNPITLPDYLLNQTYGYKKYDVALAGADTHILDKFITHCINYGIEPVFYFCTTMIGSAVLKRPDFAAMTYANMDTTTKEYFDNYQAKLFQYVIQTWGVKYVWLDIAGTGFANRNDMQLYYNAIKSIDPTCQVIGNTIGDVNFSWYPYDIGANEEIYSNVPPLTWAQVLNPSRVGYYVPQELVVNNFAGDNRWYWYDQPLRSQSSIQAMWDVAKANSSPMLLNLGPTTAGVIPQAQFDLFKNLT